MAYYSSEKDFGDERKKPKVWSLNEAKLNIERYCATQERCHQEVRYKLIEHAVYGDELEDLISDLISNNFLDEERFARTFARGKQRIKSWGKVKIISELKKRNVSPYSIKAAIEEIDENEYKNGLMALLKKKSRQLNKVTGFEKSKKLVTFAMTKGYQYDDIKKALDMINIED